MSLAAADALKHLGLRAAEGGRKPQDPLAEVAAAARADLPAAEAAMAAVVPQEADATTKPNITRENQEPADP